MSANSGEISPLSTRGFDSIDFLAGGETAVVVGAEHEDPGSELEGPGSELEGPGAELEDAGAELEDPDAEVEAQLELIDIKGE